MNPRIMIAATRSGSGKTTITCGLIRALSQKGLNVKSFKCGPDYIDPMFHKRVLGIDSKNLDLFFTDENRTRELFCLGNNSDISVIEGVMGLYDGIGGVNLEASSYHLASVIGAPVILTINAKGMGRSIVAEIAGFLEMDTKHLIKGIILNQISEAYYQELKKVIEEELEIKVLGYVPVIKDCVIDSRHLGLHLPHEIEEIDNKISVLSECMSETVDIDEIIDIANMAGCITMDDSLICTAKDNSPNLVSEDNLLDTVRIAVAKDEAFCFYYDDNLRLLKEAGAQLIEFSPIHDETLPDDIQGILMGGGYPENYLKELSENHSMLDSVRDIVNLGIPLLAECGGFMYLHEGIEAEDGIYRMAGLVKGNARFAGHLVRFGYIELTQKQGGFMGDEALRIRGHEFHYYDSDNNGSDVLATKPGSGRSWQCMISNEQMLIGYPHLYYESCPEVVTRFIEKAKIYKSGE